MINRFIASIALAAAVILPAGMAGAAESTGFLVPYPSGMKADADHAGAMVWEKGDFDRSKYDRVAIQPITVFISPKSEYQGIPADELKALTDRFYAALVQSLEPAYPVVNTPDQRTLVVRLAITDVTLKKKKKDRGLLGYTPIGFVAGTAMDAANPNIVLANAGIEAELLDGKSGERVAALADGDPFGKAGGQGDASWSAVEAKLKAYAQRFRKRMDESRK